MIPPDDTKSALNAQAKKKGRGIRRALLIF